MRLALIVLSLLILPLSTPAQEPPPAAPATGLSAEQIEDWREQLVEAEARIERAQVDAAEAQAAFRQARHRRRRGDARGELRAEMQAAEQELADAEAALPELLEEARRAGVPAGVRRKFEN
jgi:hypothetical protein